MDEIILTTMQRGGGRIIYRFSYRLDRADGKVTDWRRTKGKCKSQIKTDDASSLWLSFLRMSIVMLWMTVKTRND